jgi:hypothetical protein
VLTLCSATTVIASSGRVPDIPERIAGAQRVVVAQAINTVPLWRRNEFGDQLIITHVTLQVEETLKGTPANVLTMDIEGGTLNGVTLKVSSMTTLAPGERGVFFLDQTPGGSHAPHLKGLGILKLDDNNIVHGSSLALGDIRRMAQGGGR